MLLFSLLSRLQELIVTHRDARDLRDQIRSPSVRAISHHVGKLIDRAGSRALHRDRGVALRTSLATIATIMLGSIFWIATAWDQGAGAVLIAGVACALFGAADNAAKQIDTFMIGALAGTFLSGLYAFAVMPRVTDFVMLAAVLAPSLLVIGSVLARPALGLLALGSVVGFVNSVGLSATYSENFATYVNSSTGLIAGIVFSGLCVKLFLTAGPGQGIARLVRGGWRDVARRARGEAPDAGRWIARMLDRIGLLAPRLAQQEADPDRPLLDALVDLRIGYIAGELAALRGAMAPEEHGPVTATLAEIARYLRAQQPQDRRSPAGRVARRHRSQRRRLRARSDPRAPPRRAAAADQPAPQPVPRSAALGGDGGMIGEISIFGVFVPSLLLLNLLALVLTGIATALLQLVGFYRIIAYRPLVDLALFIFLLGLLVLVSAPFGPTAAP